MLHRNQGFFCPSCPKLFFKPKPPPVPSPVPVSGPGAGRKRSRGVIDPSNLFEMITRERHAAPRASTPRDIKIRGRWGASRVYHFRNLPSSLLK